MRTCQFLSTPALLFCLGQFAVAAELPQDVLARHGLREESGRWVLPEERRLTRLLARFDEVLREFYSTGKAWRQQMQQVDALEKELTTLEEKYQEIDGQLKRAGNLLVQQKLQQQQGLVLQRLRELRLALTKLQNQGESQLYDAARQHAKVRSDLAATAAALDDAHDRIAERYAAIAGLPDVEESLAELRASTDRNLQLDFSEAIGEPFESARSRAVKALAGLEFPHWISGGHARLAAMVNGQPVTFLIDEDQPHTWLPLSQAERIGLVNASIAPGEELKWEELSFGDDKLRAARVKSETLQVGDVTLRDVTIFVTDHEHTDVGPRLGSDLVDRLAVRIDRSRARITVGRPSPADQNSAE